MVRASNDRGPGLKPAIEPDMNTPPIDRREFVHRGAILGALTLVHRHSSLEAPRDITADAATPSAFQLEEVTIAQLQDGMSSGKYTSRSITELYLARIDEIDKHGPTVNSVIEVNPDALAIADVLDQERKEKGVRSSLHGVPIVVKDNIDTADKMRTSAGSLALADVFAAKDAFIVQRLRAAGAVIIGKTNLSEWANFRSTHSISGWSGRGGLTRNPYVLDRNACGSSSGTGAAITASSSSWTAFAVRASVSRAISLDSMRRWIA